MICFLSSFACFLSRDFLSFSSLSSTSLSYFCLRTVDSNYDFSALVYSSSLRSLSSCCYIRAYCNSWAFLALISASNLSFYLAARSFASIALLALKASSSACLSEAFSCNSLRRWIYFSFSYLIRLNVTDCTFAKQQSKLIYQPSNEYIEQFSIPLLFPLFSSARSPKWRCDWLGWFLHWSYFAFHVCVSFWVHLRAAIASFFV
jgi:hypothetical protein